MQARVIAGQIGNPFPSFKKARDILNDQFAFAGFREQYDLSLFLFMQKMNWKPKHFSKVNVTPNRPADLKLSSEAAKIVLLKNEVDRQLYEHAYRKFNEKILDLTYDQEKQLKAYLKEAKKQSASATKKRLHNREAKPSLPLFGSPEHDRIRRTCPDQFPSLLQIMKMGDRFRHRKAQIMRVRPQMTAKQMLAYLKRAVWHS